MVRRIHDHFTDGSRYGECDCPNPSAPEPSWDETDPTKVTPIAMPIAGPGVTRAELARRWHAGDDEHNEPMPPLVRTTRLPPARLLR
jgi:hypothetical protein